MDTEEATAEEVVLSLPEVVTEEEAMDMVAKPTILQLIPIAISMTSTWPLISNFNLD